MQNVSKKKAVLTLKWSWFSLIRYVEGDTLSEMHDFISPYYNVKHGTVGCDWGGIILSNY